VRIENIAAGMFLDIQYLIWHGCRQKKYELYHEGIVSYQDILSSRAKINANQKRQVESVLYVKPDEYDIDEIKKCG